MTQLQNENLGDLLIKQVLTLHKTCHLQNIRKLLNIHTSPTTIAAYPRECLTPTSNKLPASTAVMITHLFALILWSVTPAAHYEIC